MMPVVVIDINKSKNDFFCHNRDRGPLKVPSEHRYSPSLPISDRKTNSKTVAGKKYRWSQGTQRVFESPL